LKIALLHHTPINVIAKATSLPYDSKPTKELVERVWDSQHRSIARHGMACFLIEDISQSLLRQISRHPHINLTVKSSRYCDMKGSQIFIPETKLNKRSAKRFTKHINKIMTIYSKWQQYEIKNKVKDVAKLFLPLASTTDLVLSGNYQALYEMLQLRNCVNAEDEIRHLSLAITGILKLNVPEIFKDLGCRGDEFGVCPEINSCGTYPSKITKRRDDT